MRRVGFHHIFRVTCLLGLVGGCGWDDTTNSGIGDAASAKTAVRSICVTPQEADRMADQVLQLINLERASVSLPPTVRNDKLDAMAQRYACHMIGERFFGHRDPIRGDGPGERALAEHYRYWAVGENLAQGQDSAAEVMKAWMQSSPHRAIILDHRWKDVGVAVRTSSDADIYWVLEFGDPATP